MPHSIPSSMLPPSAIKNREKSLPTSWWPIHSYCYCCCCCCCWTTTTMIVHLLLLLSHFDFDFVVVFVSNCQWRLSECRSIQSIMHFRDASTNSPTIQMPNESRRFPVRRWKSSLGVFSITNVDFRGGSMFVSVSVL